MARKPSGGGEDESEIAGVFATEKRIGVRVCIDGIQRVISSCGGGGEIENGFAGASGGGGGQEEDDEEGSES